VLLLKDIVGLNAMLQILFAAKAAEEMYENKALHM
jgi:hypothetical protein